MIQVLDKKHLVLGVTGSIACYKALDLASKLTQAGARVDVIMTYGATQFVSALAFSSITHRPVVTDLFDPQSTLSIEHVTLAERADLVIIAPATAHYIAKIALGLADDPLSTTLLATKAPVIVAPAMDGGMYDNAITQENLIRLKDRGITIVGPTEGRLASGIKGVGRLVEPPELMGHIRALLGATGDLSGTTIVVSAGGTQEPIDPARIITNRSSGKMGYALAEAARDRGAHSILVTAPTGLPDPVAVDVIKVKEAVEMRDQLMRTIKKAQVLIMAAAVSDYKAKKARSQKLKNKSGDITIELTRNPDILAELSGNFIKVGFAAESQNITVNARSKLIQKGLDLMVANDITDPDAGFESDTNRVTILDREGSLEKLPLLHKEEVAHRLLDRVKDLMGNRA